MAFGDYMIKESARGKVRAMEEVNPQRVRLHKWLGVGIALAVGLLLVRLVSLQLISGGRMRVLANENRIRQLKLSAPRGKILDRNGQILADNRAILRIIPDSKLTVDDWQRRYPQGELAAHVVGYLGEVGQDEVGLLGEGSDKYRLQDMIGRSGVEQQYESRLRGRDGGRLVEVDSSGEVVRELGRKLPIAGQDVQLSLDMSLQQAAMTGLAGKKGAVVATNPHTGEVLVLASSPAFNPLDLSASLNGAELPLLNRAIGGIYAPGSTFKMITSLAALAEGKLDAGFTYTDTGTVSVGQFAYTNWYFTQYGKTEGVTGWVKGLTRSVDTFFYKVGEYTGPDLLAKWANNLGFGVKTGIDMPGEVAGLVPTPAWKEQTKGEKWFLGNTYHMAIGQGDLLVTPLQVNAMIAILASRGQNCRPHLVKDTSVPCSKTEVDPKIWDIIDRGMRGACSAGGTAFPLFDFVPAVACKTGTAEYIRSDGRIGTHAWLTAYAPADDPTIVISVLVEGGGEGSRAAAPIVRQVLAKYFGVEDHYNYAAVSGVGE